MKHGPIGIAVVCVAAALAAAVPARAAVYWIATQGTDTPSCVTATGCSAAACRTYTYLASRTTIRPGDTIQWCPGVYTQNCICPPSGTAGAVITYRSSTGSPADVTLNTPASGPNCSCGGSPGQGMFALQNGAGDYVTIKGFTLNLSGAAGYRDGIDVGQGRHHILVEDVHVTRATQFGVFLGPSPGNCSSSSPCTDTSSYLHDVTLRRVEVDNSGFHGVAVYQCRNGCVFEDLHIHDNMAAVATDGIHIANAAGFRISGGRFYRNHEEGIDLSRTATHGYSCNDYNSGACLGGTNANRRCLDDSDCPGSSCTPWIIENTTVWGGNSGSSRGVAAIAIKECSHKGILRNNLVKYGTTAGAYLDAVQFDSCAHDIAMYNNTLYGSLTFWNNQYGMDVRNNIILNPQNMPAVRLASGNVGEPGGSSLRPGAQGKANLTADRWDYNWVKTTAGSNAAGTAFSGGGMSGSPLVQPEPGRPRCVYNPPSASNPSGRNYANTNLAAWRADAPLDGGTGAHDIWNAPNVGFVQTADPPDLRLTSADASGAKNNGLDLAALVAPIGFTTDVDGGLRPAQGTWDIGAFEFGATPANPAPAPPVLLSVEVQP